MENGGAFFFVYFLLHFIWMAGDALKKKFPHLGEINFALYTYSILGYVAMALFLDFLPIGWGVACCVIAAMYLLSLLIEIRPVK